MPACPRIQWSSAQSETLKIAKQELHAFLNKIDYQGGEDRRVVRGDEGMSVNNFRDKLIERMMRMEDATGTSLFPVEVTQVWTFNILKCRQLLRSSQSVMQSLDNYLNLTYLRQQRLSSPDLTTKQVRGMNIQMLHNQEEPSGKNVFKNINYEQILALARSMPAKGKGDNSGSRFIAAWTSLWKECEDQVHYERLAALDKWYSSSFPSSHSLNFVQ
jgi:hypothetical protein